MGFLLIRAALAVPLPLPESLLLCPEWLDNQFTGAVASFFSEPDLHRFARQIARYATVESPIQSGNRDQLGIEASAEDACLGIAAGARQCTTVQGGVDVDVAVGDDFGTGVDRGENDQVAATCVDLLPRTQGPSEEQRWRPCASVTRCVLEAFQEVRGAKDDGCPVRTISYPMVFEPR